MNIIMENFQIKNLRKKINFFFWILLLQYIILFFLM